MQDKDKPTREGRDRVQAFGFEIVGFRGLSGPLLPESPLEEVGAEAPHLFQWALR